MSLYKLLMLIKVNALQHWNFKDLLLIKELVKFKKSYEEFLISYKEEIKLILI